MSLQRQLGLCRLQAERMRQLGLRVGDYQELDRAGAYQLGRVPKSRFRS